MSEQQKSRNQPWWVFSTNPVPAALFTLIFGFQLVLLVIRLVNGDGEWWDAIYLVALIGIVVSGVASMVYFARKAGSSDAPRTLP